MSESALDALSDIETIRYAQLSCLTIILYDHLLTFNMEIELIWGSRWTMAKILLLLNRYYSLISLIVSNYVFFTPELTDSLYVTNIQRLRGLRYYQWLGWTGLIACILSESLLQLRIYALWRMNKLILCLLVLSFIATTTSAATIMGIVLSKITAKAVPIPNGLFCVPFNVPDTFYRFWIPPLAFESLLCALAITQAVQAYMVNGTFFHSAKGLIYILIRDSVLYYVVVFATYLTCLLVWVIGRVGLLDVPIGFSVVMSSVMANRIILNLRVAGQLSSPRKSQTIETMMHFNNPNLDTYARGGLSER